MVYGIFNRQNSALQGFSKNNQSSKIQGNRNKFQQSSQRALSHQKRCCGTKAQASSTNQTLNTQQTNNKAQTTQVISNQQNFAQIITMLQNLIAQLQSSFGANSSSKNSGVTLGANGGTNAGSTQQTGNKGITINLGAYTGGNTTINITFGCSNHSGHGNGGDPTTPPSPDNPWPNTPDPDTPEPPQGGYAKPEGGETFNRLTHSNYEREEHGNLPNARDVSNAVADQKGAETSNANGASDILWSWGQFIDHDMTLTEEGEKKSTIAVPRGDAYLDPTHSGAGFIPYTESKTVDGEQINKATPLIDGSMVYGNNKEQTDGLREFAGGRLALDNGFLPASNDAHLVKSGDPRAAEQPGLLSLQTLFAREHNRLAEKLAAEDPSLSDEQIFQKARKLVSAEIQAITYNEFLPILIGENPEAAGYSGTGENDGKVSNEFASAAYRLGHTMVSDSVAYKKEDGTLGQATLDEVFFNPDFTTQKGIGSILSGQSEQTAEKADPLIVDSLRNKLFGPPGSGAPGLDLAALNIQRGREHGMPSYNEMRASLGQPKVTSFDDPIFQDGVGAKLASVYASPDEIDLWVGGLAEKPVGNSMLGKTFTTIVGQQFAKTAAADASFYTREFSTADQAWLKELSLSDVIRANSQADIDDTAFIATD